MYCVNQSEINIVLCQPIRVEYYLVSDGQELHDSLVQVEILQTLEEVGVPLTIVPQHAQLLGLGLGGEHGHGVVEPGHLDRGGHRVVAGQTYVRVPEIVERGRDLRQLE